MQDTDIKILLIADHLDDAGFWHQVFSPVSSRVSWQIVPATPISQVLTDLAALDVDVILLSLGVTDWQKLALLQALYQAAASIPIVVLSDNADEAIALEMLRQGAQDYLVKSQIEPTLLMRSLRYAIARAQAIQRLQRQSAAIKAEEALQFNQFVEIRNALAKEKELNELKSNFVSMVSHEFRNPLSAIVLSSELLERYAHKASEEQKLKYLKRIQDASDRMTELLDEILIIGRAEAGKLIYQPKAIALTDFCQELIDELQLSSGQQHHLRFSYTGSPASPPQMDENLLRHILGNLLSNALKYSPESSVVRFTLTYQANQAVFTVQDTGIGIPPEDQPRLFESFYRATNVGMIPGTGLGLAIVKKCVDAHKGQITVASTVGQGTTFIVTLPLQPSAEPPSHPPHSQPEQS